MKPGTRLLLMLCAAALMAPSHSTRRAEATRPNIIFILTHDQGWGDARFAGHPYVKTPNLDRFASQATWFRQFYVAATVCSPSRCAFMTSHYPARHQIHGHFAEHALNASRHMPDWLDPKAVTVTKLLRDAGYATGHLGKWHLGGGDGAPTPGDYGIDVHRTVNATGPALGEDSATTPGGKKNPEPADPYFRAKSTTMIVDETICFIRANKDRPFYANVWTLLPHAPLNPTPEQLKVYESLAPRADDPAFGEWRQKYLAAAKDLKSQMRVFCASPTDLDTQIGRLLQALDELRLADNTIVFFSSDNGAEDYRIANAANAGVGSTGPLRARKRSMYEGGIRTCGLLRWPGHVAAGRVDETSVLAGVDWLPTICRLTGVTVSQSLLGAAFTPTLGGDWFARFTAALLLGAALNGGILMLSQIARAWHITPESWRWIFKLAAVPAVLGLLVLLALPESPLWLAARWRSPSPALRAFSPPLGERDGVRGTPTSSALRELLRPPLLHLTLVGILLGSIPRVGAWAASKWMIPWADKIGGASQAGYKAVTQGWWALGAVLGSFFGAQIAAWLGRRRAYAIISAGATALTSLMFLGTAPLRASFLPIVFAQGFVATLFFGWLPLYLPELFPTRVRAAGSGIAYNVGRFATALGVLMAGALFTTMGGSYPMVGATCGLIYLLGLIVIWWAPDTTGNKLQD